MERAERLLTLVGEIYEAGLEPARWDHVLTQVCDEVGALGALLGYYEPRIPAGQTAAYVRLDPDLLRLFHAHYLSNPWTEAELANVNVGRGHFTDVYIPYGDLCRTAFYADILAPQSIHSAYTAHFVGGGGGVGGLSMMFRHGPGEVDPDERRAIEYLLPHLHRAVEIQGRLNGATLRQEAAEQAMDELRRGVVTIDCTGEVRFVNAAARAILAAADGLSLRAGHLHAADPASDRRLASLVTRTLGDRDAALVDAGGWLAVPRPSGHSPYLLMIHPLRSRTSWLPAQHAAALCFITDPDAELRLRGTVLEELYGLTPTEGRVAVAVAEGRGLTHAARVLGVRASTARSHLQRVFDKTGVRSQAAVALLVTQVFRGLPRSRRLPRS
jgi:DNA-binding CsgD family transcriptional regulator